MKSCSLPLKVLFLPRSEQDEDDDDDGSRRLPSDLNSSFACPRILPKSNLNGSFSERQQQMKPIKSRAVSPPAARRHWHCRRGGKPRDDHPDGSPAVLCRLVLPLLFLAALVAYLLGLWYCASFFSALGSTSPAPPPTPLGSVYRSNELFQKLLPEMLSDNSSAAQVYPIISPLNLLGNLGFVKYSNFIRDVGYLKEKENFLKICFHKDP